MCCLPVRYLREVRRRRLPHEHRQRHRQQHHGAQVTLGLLRRAPVRLEVRENQLGLEQLYQEARAVLDVLREGPVTVSYLASTPIGYAVFSPSSFTQGHGHDWREGESPLFGFRARQSAYQRGVEELEVGEQDGRRGVEHQPRE